MIKIKNYIFLTDEGYTQEPDGGAIENLQVIGFSKGKNGREAFNNLVNDYDYLLDTTFDKIHCLPLSNNFKEEKKYFYLKSD